MIINKEINNQLYDELFGHYSDTQLAVFGLWLGNNDHIYTRFKQLAHQIRDSGRPHYSSKMLVNVLRWETDLIDSEEEFKVDDKYQALLGRMLEWEDNSFIGFFKRRVRK